MDAQFCPALVNAPQTRPCAVRSSLQSLSTMAASLPPSSSEQGTSRSAQATAMRRPVATLPVNTTPSGPASTRAAPTSPPPWTIWSTPAGRRPSKSEKSSLPDRAAISLGFQTTALPARSAGTSVRSGIATG